MKLIHTLSVACTAAALMLPVSGVSYAGDSAFAAGAVGSIAYADKDSFFGFPYDETSIAAGGAVGVVATHGTGDATLDANWDARASTNNTSDQSSVASVSGDGDGDGDGGGSCNCSTSARSSGGLSLSASSSD
jgi:hypothetical protein